MVEHHQIDELKQLLEQSPRVLLTGPAGVDGDSIGACLALAQGIEQHLGKSVDVAGVAPYRYDWMPGADKLLADDELEGVYDLVIVMDGDKGRLTQGMNKTFAEAKARGLIDHHGTNSPDGYDIAMIDGGAAATVVMVAEIFDRWGVELNRELAENLYVGLIFDTGGFRHSNTSPEVLRLAARLVEQEIDAAWICYRVLSERTPPALSLLSSTLTNRTLHNERLNVGVCTLEAMKSAGAEKADLEGIVDALLYVRGVDLAMLVVELPGERVKLSLRSRGDVDVAAFARSMSPQGGGHVKAAGVTIKGPLDEVVNRAVSALLAQAG